jgi:biopolymer transport protein ExbD
MAFLGLGSSDDEDIISGINVTPLVDVSLVLLIIFIATSAIIVRAAINVDLPRAATAGDALPDSVAVVVERTGQLQLDGAAVTREQLEAAVRARVAANPQLRVMIAADRALDYGSVMDVIDLVRECGASGFSLNVERESREQP